MSKITRRVALQGIGAASLLPLLPLDLGEQKEKPTMCEEFYMPGVDKEFWITTYNGHKPSLMIGGFFVLYPDQQSRTREPSLLIVM